MTATATITTAERTDVLLVPNAALRFSPEAARAGNDSSSGGGIVGQLMPRAPRGKFQILIVMRSPIVSVDPIIDRIHRGVQYGDSATGAWDAHGETKSAVVISCCQ
jgi:hypothetical protein